MRRGPGRRVCRAARGSQPTRSATNRTPFTEGCLRWPSRQAVEETMNTNIFGEKASGTSRGRPDGGRLGLLRTVALVAVVVGAGGSLALMLRVGHRNKSGLLLVLFAIWVLSPFVALASANAISKRWPVLTQATLYTGMLVITLGSLAIYGE